MNQLSLLTNWKRWKYFDWVENCFCFLLPFSTHLLGRICSFVRILWVSCDQTRTGSRYSGTSLPLEAYFAIFWQAPVRWWCLEAAWKPESWVWLSSKDATAKLDCPERMCHQCQLGCSEAFSSKKLLNTTGLQQLVPSGWRASWHLWRISSPCRMRNWQHSVKRSKASEVTRLGCFTTWKLSCVAKANLKNPGWQRLALKSITKGNFRTSRKKQTVQMENSTARSR